MKFYIRYNAQEGKVTETINTQFDGYFFGAPNLEYFKAAASQLVLSTKKSFVIDPHTFHLVDEKRSHEKYVSKLSIENLDDVPKRKEDRLNFVNKFVGFQENEINETLSEDPIEDITERFTPEFLIPPYKFIDDCSSDTLAQNVQFILDVKELRPTSKAYAPIFITKDILIESDSIKRICDAYANPNVDGFCIAVDDFDAYTISLEYLVGFKNFVTELTKIGKPIWSLHASFFELLLKDRKLDAIVHGVDTGDRLKIASGGFGKRQFFRYYVPPLKKRFSPTEIDYLKKNAPELMNCDCGYCNKENLSRNDLMSHYIICRSREVNQFNKEFDHLGTLKETFKKYSEPLKYVINLGYIERWIKAVE